MTSSNALLTSEALASFLAAHPEWKVEGGMLLRTYELPTFREAIAFVERVAGAAEAADHHPDIDIRWRKVRLCLVTHDAGGLTGLDSAMAAEADRLLTAS